MTKDSLMEYDDKEEDRNYDLLVKVKNTTGCKASDCMGALYESDFDYDKAVSLLTEKGLYTLKS